MQLQHLRLHGHVQGGGGLVGDEQPRLVHERHRDQHALAHPTGELVRVLVEPPSGITDAHSAQHVRGQLAGLSARHLAVDPYRFDDLVADGEDRVQAREGILEHHRRDSPPDATQRGLVEWDEIGSLEHD